MIYLMYTEDIEGNIDIQRCRDEIHYLDMLVDVESRTVIVPYDIRFHGDNAVPPMRILALSSDHADLSQSAGDIINLCALWLRQN